MGFCGVSQLTFSQERGHLSSLCYLIHAGLIGGFGLRREVADLRERVAKQEERIAELERRLNRNSRNSSLPPSQDPPAAPERRQAPPSGRGRGAQPGHSGHGRHLAPLESIDAVIDRK